jgi:hypothetical protein
MAGNQRPGPVPRPARAGDGIQLYAVLWAADRELRSAQLAVALAGTRLRTDESRARYASVIRKVTATGEDTAALMARWAERWPHRAERLLALSAAAENAAREARRAADGADGAGRGGAAPVDPPAAGPVRPGAGSPEAVRLRSRVLAQRLDQAIAGVRATTARIEQGRPRQEMLRHSAFARMRAKLASLPVIEQAKGIIMAQSSYSEDQAFDLLRRTSQRQNVPVRELAAHIVAKAAGSPEASGGRRTQPRAAHR